MKPLVSLLVPVYNSMPYLKDMVQSIEDQTWRPLECIFTDDGSSDDSLEYLYGKKEDLERSGITVKILVLTHGGQAAAVDAALKQATGEYLTWCDADDKMAPCCIEAKADYLEEHHDIGMVRNDGVICDDDGNVLSNSARESDRKEQDIFEELLRQTTYCYAGCYMIRMKLFDECYPDRSIPISSEGQNLQLLLPPASRTVCGFIPEVLHYYYRRSCGHSSMKRSYSQTFERKMNFIRLYKDILPFCQCDQEYYGKVIGELKDQYMEELRCSVLSQIRKEMKDRESGNSNIS